MEQQRDDIFRLNKYIAHCGVCNRKEAVDLIKKGEIMVNGIVELNPFYEIKPDDQVFYKKKQIIKEETKVYLLFNKPKNMPVFPYEGYTKPTVIDLLKRKSDIALKPAMPITELSSGLIILTNDTQLIDKMSGQDNMVHSIYEIVLDSALSEEDFQVISHKIINKTISPNIKGLRYVTEETKSVISIEAAGSFDDEIIIFFKNFNYHVQKLDRMQLGSLTKKDLKRGWSRHLTEKEVIFIKYFR